MLNKKKVKSGKLKALDLKSVFIVEIYLYNKFIILKVDLVFH